MDTTIGVLEFEALDKRLEFIQQRLESIDSTLYAITVAAYALTRPRINDIEEAQVTVEVIKEACRA